MDSQVIRLEACTSKVNAPRIVPLSAAAMAWLEWAGITAETTGLVCKRNPTQGGETARLGREIFGEAGWPHDALRHSYGSYRNALIRNLPQVAEEMGTSEKMLRKHYHNPKTLEEGEAWFAQRPEGFRCGPMEEGVDTGEEVAKRAGFSV